MHISCQTIFKVANSTHYIVLLFGRNMSSMENKFGYIVRVTNKHGDFWLGQNVYASYDSALVVKHNVKDSGRYNRVYVVPATEGQFNSALYKG